MDRMNYLDRFLTDPETNELVVVEITGGSDCSVAMYEKENSAWKELFRCPGFIGREGAGKTREGDWKTPLGVFALKTPFGSFPDIGSKQPYTRLNEHLYWCDDKEYYNRMIDIRSCPHNCTGEHLIDYIHYRYSMLIDYNSECIPGLGNAIFLHCFGGKPYSAGCVAIDLNSMKTVLRHAGEGAKIAIYELKEKEKMLKDIAKEYYHQNNYNCAETIIRAGNDFYGLGLNDRDMIMVGGFGAGMQTGNICGAILSAISVLSMKYIEANAHESADIKPVTMLLTRKFNEKYGSTLCRDIKPQSFVKEVRCENTILAACDILEQTIAEYEAGKA